eukprot:CAMPEP_0201595936 /NCGR_PEP_ID=MMETSP0190_2-20130828/192773_1 /ASSEMBLY_ACC=CAM_ASM_000263 /TAXON_ID=37353 /ORGANISM="Rosalina sp." /LENGTH=492 /DNA_ID=CAMNT_0048056091 /DNA_START=724 /DNA_END=2202 /DNA_ORIENTATION=-
MTLNPLDNNILAVGCRDKWVRLFDRRTLSVGNGKRAKPYRLLTQHSLLHKKSSSRYMDSEGITGLAWSYDGQELVASYSAGNIALFNLYADMSCRDFTDCKDIVKEYQNSEQQSRELLSRFPNANNTSSEDDDSDDDDDNDEEEDDLNVEEEEMEQDEDEDEDNDDTTMEDKNIAIDIDIDIEDDDNKQIDGEENTMDQDVLQFLADDEDNHEHIVDDDNKEQQEMVAQIVASSPTNPSNNRVKKAVTKAKRLMTDIKEKANTKSDKFKEKIKKRLPHNLFSKKSSISSWNYHYEKGYIPYSLQISNYKGHRTVETVKECNFFGPQSEYIISGSDCSHAFIWRKSDGKIVNVIKGDSRITNVVQGNPINCSLVTSGLDKTVKLFTPTAETACNKSENELDERNKQWNNIINTNQRDSESASRPIPMSLLVYLLRRGLYGFDVSDDDDEDDQDQDQDEDDDHKEDNNNRDEDQDEDDRENGQDALLQFLEQDR